MNIKTILLKSVIIASIFTFLDTLVHTLFSPLEITYYPFNWFTITNALYNYSISKFIATFVFFIIALYICKKLKFKKPAFNLVSGLILISLLELRYIYSGYYTTQFHIFNFINHAIILVIAMLITEMVVKK